MQAESTSTVRVVRWLGALGVLLTPLASGCVAGEVPREETGTVEQAAVTCVCVDEVLCGRDTCSEPTKVCLGVTCFRPDVHCNVQSDGTACTTNAGLRGECESGICFSEDCPGCVAKGDLCVTGTSVSACGIGGALCENCNDNNPCTTDSCYTNTKLGIRYCRHVDVGDGTACTNGVCIKGSCCTGCVTEAGACSSGTLPGACGSGGKDCAVCPDSDDSPCTVPACTSGGQCGMSNLPAGTSCADADVCDGTETCNASGTCLAGTPVSCDDGNPCTSEACDPSTGCTTPSPTPGATCSDANPCTVGDQCSAAGTCEPGEPANCSDGESCTTDSCDPASGECLHEPLADDTECDDGNGCTDNDRCTEGKCVGEGEVTCEDRGPCVVATCESDVCSYDSTVLDGEPCLDDPCKVGQTCQDGDCTGGEDKDCSDNNPCTEDTCDADTGKCVSTPFSAECSDGNPCTLDDTCNEDGECVGTEMTCAPLDECHNPGTCDSASGLCSDPRKPNGSECLGGECIDGRCEVTEAAAGAGGVTGTSGAGGADIVVPQGGDGGAGAAGAPGVGGPDPSVAGQTAAAGSSSEAGGKSSTADQAGAAGKKSDNAAGRQSTDNDAGAAGIAEMTSKVFKRNPGGCDCRTSTGGPNAGWLAVALGLVAVGRRRRPRGL